MSALKLLPTVVVVTLSLLAQHVEASELAHVCRYCGRDHRALPMPGDLATTNGRQYAPDRQADVRHIKLDVTPNFDEQTVAGTATLVFAPIAKPLTSLRLDAVGLEVKEVRSPQGVRSHSTDERSLTIVFKEPLPVGAEATVEIDYTAEPVQGLYFRTAKMGLPKGDDHCWTQGEPHEARHWFPSFDSPNERSTTEIICHVPRDMTVVANGRLVGETNEGDSMKAVHWLQEKPHVSYLICMVAGHLEKLAGQHRDVPLGFYTQPSKAKYAANAFRDTADVMKFFEEEIGVPFPWNKYDQVTCADYHWGGMENTTLTTLTQRTIHADEIENVRSARSLVAHEMAHQWFGDYVTCKDWSHLWLNEGFATYYALLHERHQHGADAFHYGLYVDARDKIAPMKSDLRPMVYRKYKDPGEQFDFRNYPKGSWVLHMLRHLVGEDVYRQAVRSYLERHALSDVETEDLREAFEEASGRPLDKFFDQWVYHGGVPELKVVYRWLPEEKQARVTVEQTHATSDDVLLFELETKLRFVVDGKTVDEPVKIDGRRHDFYVTLPGEPQVVRFDPEYTLLARIDFDVTDKLLRAQLAQEQDAIGRVLACDALAKRKTKANVAALKKALNDDAFYGVRLAAAEALRKIGTDEAIAALVESTDQDDARVRQQLAKQLAACYRDAARARLLEVAEREKNPAVAAAAVEGLGRYRDDAVRAALEAALEADSHADEVATAAFSAIGEQQDPRFAEKLMSTIKARDAELAPADAATGMLSLAKISQRGRRQDEALDFLAGYLSHPRQTLRGAAIAALGKLHDPAARPLLEPIAADQRDQYLAETAATALVELDKEAPLVPAEVGELRREVRELRKSHDKLEKALDELKAKRAAGPAASGAEGKQPRKN